MIRTVDRERLSRRLDILAAPTIEGVLQLLREMFEM
jgi:hypothetical protein